MQAERCECCGRPIRSDVAEIGGLVLFGIVSVILSHLIQWLLA